MSKTAKIRRIGAMRSQLLLPRAMAMSVFVVGLAGCSYSPEFNILGSYFPSWIVCLAIAIALTFGAHFLFAKRKLVDQLWPLPLIYTSLVCFLSCTLWIIFFE
jgi:protein-S-isoprenylcysteine O-methyltransferase Ste14